MSAETKPDAADAASGITRIETADIKITWDSTENAFRAYPKSDMAKTLFTCKKLKKGGILAIRPESDAFQRILELQNGVGVIASMWAEK